ncbi:MAG: alpha/beta hydrolase [Oscillospiraceae bacterium]|jgi:dipeptidyl aminopeptidase/acylaminoacyl peptidase|nr:alpha/beta hydrolase [Oscillospiraceae bacterium]
MKKFLILLILALTLCAGVSCAPKENRNQDPESELSNSVYSELEISSFELSSPELSSSEAATTAAESRPEELKLPEALEKMTVPYLRTLDYSSKLEYDKDAVVEYGENFRTYIASYMTNDGFKLNGLLAVPEGEAPEGGWPAVVFIHGYKYPPTYETNGSSYRNYWGAIARAGYVVFKIDLRGHGVSEGRANGPYFSGSYIIDALCARGALQSCGFVNPDGIGLWGHSMAGNIVSRSMAVQPEIPAGVIWAGAVYTYTDFAEYGITDPTYVAMSSEPPVSGETDRADMYSIMQDLRGNPSELSKKFFGELSMLNYIGDLKGALEIHHAIDDDVVSVEYSRNLAGLLEEKGADYEYYEYETGGHNITAPSFSPAMERTLAFYDKRLKGAE